METLTIKTIGPGMLHGEQILITGNCPLLGGWDPEKALPMTVTQGVIWSVDLDKSRIPDTFEFKFILRKADGGIVWETCFNRTNPYAVTETTFPGQHPRYAGTAVPVFALRSGRSSGTRGCSGRPGGPDRSRRDICQFRRVHQGDTDRQDTARAGARPLQRLLR